VKVQSSSSIIHDIIKLIDERKEKLKVSMPTRTSFSIDPDLQQVVRGDEVLFDVHHAPQYEVVPEGTAAMELKEVWTKHRKAYNQRMMTLLSERSPENNKIRTNVGVNNSPLRTDIDVDKNSIIRDYILLFDDTAMKLWMDYKNGRGNRVVHVDLLSMRRILAAIVYTICLEDNDSDKSKGINDSDKSKGINDSDKSKGINDGDKSKEKLCIYSIDFCWKICFHELTFNKHQSVQRRQGAPALQHRLK